MAISNTSILIKRSQSTAKPTSLNQGELGYSYVSNTLFFGTAGGNGVVNVGGQYYTSTIDSATSGNAPGTIVKRDASGNSYFGNIIVSGTITGTINAIVNSANSLYNTQNFSISGGDITASAVAFNGTQPVALNAS